MKTAFLFIALLFLHLAAAIAGGGADAVLNTASISKTTVHSETHNIQTCSVSSSRKSDGIQKQTVSVVAEEDEDEDDFVKKQQALKFLSSYLYAFVADDHADHSSDISLHAGKTAYGSAATYILLRTLRI